MKILDWLQDRTGYRELTKEALDEPVPGGARLAYVWGSALTLTFLTQAVTGALLMTAYQPSATTAWSSVLHISHTMSMGWLVRGLHHYGAQAMVVLLVMHLGQTAIHGAYKKPREMNWLLGLGLMGLTLAFSLTGYLLPWDQKGYWATKVATNIAGTIPLIGGFTQRLLVGGADYGHATLTRFYALHVFLLPAALVGLLAAHVALFRKHGVTPPPGADLKKVDRFYPKQLTIDLAIGLVTLGIVYALAMKSHGAPLDAPADPASDYPARPEWYFLALFEALKYVPGNVEWIVAVGLPLVAGGYLVALPFLDKKPTTALKPRLGLLAPLALGVLGAVALTLSSMRSDSNNPDFVAARKLAEERAARAAELAKAGVPPAGPLALLASDPATRGPELFDKHCASCHRLGAHGPEAGKDTAPDLTGYGTEAWVLALLDNPDADTLFGKTPFKGEMPSVVRPAPDDEYKDAFVAMKPEDMKTIAAFLVGESSGTGGKGTPGEKMVKERCQSCHRIDGATDAEDSNAPELRAWASPAWIAAQIANPGSGKTYPKSALPADPKGHMPAFESQLGADEIKLLANWVYTSATGRAGGELGTRN
jgi:ubiquinol-cytochrome c reductase cytochrome b subunit